METEAARLFQRLRGEVSKVIVGLDEAVESLAVAFLSDGHVLIEGVPGLAKTLLAKTFAKALGLSFKRIQFTADILPSDIIGSVVLNRKTNDFEFRKGPIFANIVLVDEINRAPPRSQSALLEAMQERQVTVEGVVYKLPSPFMVIATQNPIELEGTYALPEAELDRFMMRINIEFPSKEQEVAILRMKDKQAEEEAVERIADLETIVRVKDEVRNVFVHGDILDYIVRIARRTREDSRVMLGVSPRAEIFLLHAAKAKAALEGRNYVIPDDVKSMVYRVFNHRIILKPEYQNVTLSSDNGVLRDIFRECVFSVRVPR